MVPGVFVFFFLVQPMFGGLLFSANAQIGVRDEKEKGSAFVVSTTAQKRMHWHMLQQ